MSTNIRWWDLLLAQETVLQTIDNYTKSLKVLRVELEQQSEEFSKEIQENQNVFTPIIKKRLHYKHRSNGKYK